MEFVDLLETSSMAAFAVFLIYLYKQQMARMDALVDKFQSQLENTRKEYKIDVEELRNRYDAVVANYNEEAKETRTTLSDRLNAVGQNLRKVGTDLSSLYVSHESNREEIRDLSSKVEQGIKIVQSMQEEARLKEIARAAAVRNTGDKD